MEKTKERSEKSNWIVDYLSLIFINSLTFFLLGIVLDHSFKEDFGY